MSDCNADAGGFRVTFSFTPARRLTPFPEPLDALRTDKSMPTFRNLIERRREEMDTYRRLLRARYHPAFDRLFEHANLHAPSAKMASDPDYGWLILFNMVLGNQREIRELREAIGGLDDIDVDF